MKEKIFPLGEALRAHIEAAPKARGAYADLRERARNVLASGLPSKASESYRFTDLRPFIEDGFVNNLGLNGSSPRHASHRALINTILDLNQNLDKDIEIAAFPIDKMSDTPCEEYILLPEVSTPAALNAALFDQEYHITISPETCFKQPVTLPLLDRYARIIIHVGQRAKVAFIDMHDTLGFRNPVCEIRCDKGSQVALYRSVGGTYLGALGAKLFADSHFHLVQLALSGSKIRQDIMIRLAEPGAKADLYGLYIVNENQHCDHTICMRHDAPQTSSQKTFKGIVAGHGVFQGRIEVPRDSQKIEGYQMHRGLILSSGARLNTKPELEIFADDVRCSHGATISEIDSLSLFYLKSRGISTATASRLLLSAFANDILEKVTCPSAQSLISEKLNRRIEAITAQCVDA